MTPTEHTDSAAEPYPAGGWIMGQSIALELDTALTAAGGYFPLGNVASEFTGIVESIPVDWRAEWPLYLGEPGRFVTELHRIAELTGVVTEADYSQATLAMRELTLEQALVSVTRQAALHEIDAPPAGSPATQLGDLAVQLSRSAYAVVGLQPTAKEAREGQVRDEMTRVVRILRDGDLHARFWHWLDRFYYEIYRPWRISREPDVAALEAHAMKMLGAREKQGTPPKTKWLPPQNPLLTYHQLGAAVRSGRVPVFFWADPFALGDMWGVGPGQVVVAFANPGLLYRDFEAFVEKLALRTKALSDPTRLVILRLIRHLGMMNTEIANYLKLARPTVSIHAKILREAGLIRSHQRGREIRHEIVPEEIRLLFADLERFLDLPGEEDP